jgi:hypothetical protein
MSVPRGTGYTQHLVVQALLIPNIIDANTRLLLEAKWRPRASSLAAFHASLIRLAFAVSTGYLWG